MGNTQEQQPTARVFISCGQRSDKEKQLGFACREYFKSRGFATYLAEKAHSLEALTEDIFQHLRNSEYAVFIDCEREKLSPGNFRGSVFVNQELAIAAFLPIEESRVFHEKRVVPEGVAKHLIAKPIHFSDEQEFLGKLDEETNEWRNDWRNELSVKFYGVLQDFRNQDDKYGDWYHLEVSNNHQNKYARNCVAYVSRIKNLDTGGELDPGSFELVWSGTGLFERHLMHNSTALVDAFFIIRGQNVIRFNSRRSTSPPFGIRTLQKGNYLLTYLVVSENFEEVTKTFKLEFGGDYTQINFFEWSEDVS